MGLAVGFLVGLAVGFLAGLAVGFFVGTLMVTEVGLLVGFLDVGFAVGGVLGGDGAWVHVCVDTWFHILTLTRRGSRDTSPSPARRGEFL